MALTIFLIVFAIINGIYFLYYSKLSFTDISADIQSEDYPVSLIVCARNEAENLRQHIPFWLAQDYPNFELIVVNDHSNDETLDVIKWFAKKDSRVIVVDVKQNENFLGKKKYALTLGIRKARYSRLLFTDADCKPAGNSWIRSMTSRLSNEKQLVLGYGGYNKTKRLLNALIRFETVMTAFQYFSAALRGHPYMGVGRNLAYTSNLFYDQSGFTSHIHVDSGDDDLFVNQAATPKNTAVCLCPESFTHSIPKQKWSSWIRQKARHSTTAHYYSLTQKLILGLYYFSNLAFWFTLICGLLINWPLFLAIGLGRMILQYALLSKGFKRLGERDLIWALPLLDLFLVLMQLVIFISSFKKTVWK